MNGAFVEALVVVDVLWSQAPKSLSACMGLEFLIKKINKTKTTCLVAKTFGFSFLNSRATHFGFCPVLASVVYAWKLHHQLFSVSVIESCLM